MLNTLIIGCALLAGQTETPPGDDVNPALHELSADAEEKPAPSDPPAASTSSDAPSSPAPIAAEDDSDALARFEKATLIMVPTGATLVGALLVFGVVPAGSLFFYALQTQRNFPITFATIAGGGGGQSSAIADLRPASSGSRLIGLVLATTAGTLGMLAFVLPLAVAPFFGHAIYQRFGHAKLNRMRLLMASFLPSLGVISLGIVVQASLLGGVVVTTALDDLLIRDAGRPRPIPGREDHVRLGIAAADALMLAGLFATPLVTTALAAWVATAGVGVVAFTE